MAEKKTYRLLIAYEGSAFKGWHTQANVPTVQGTLNTVLSELYKEKIFIWGAGRTDSGAHGLKYTAHFRTHNDYIPCNNIKQVLNGKLPPEIRVYQVFSESNKFHATFGCKARTYCYIVYLGEVLPPHYHKRVYQEFGRLNIELLQEVLKKFHGTHNFSQFCYGYNAKERLRKSMVRRIDYFHVKQKGEYLYFFIKGEGFLRGMIRTLIGASLSVAKGSMSIENIEAGLNGTPMLKNGVKAVPAEGLYFKRAHF